jgi:hypothetical protein
LRIDLGESSASGRPGAAVADGREPLGRRERLVDAQPGPPERRRRGAQATPVGAVAGGAMTVQCADFIGLPPEAERAKAGVPARKRSGSKL